MKKSNPVDLEKEKNTLFKEIEELEREIEDIKKRIPPHSVQYGMIRLLEEKEQELERKRLQLRVKKE